MNLKQLHDAMVQLLGLYKKREHLEFILSPAGAGVGVTGRDRQPTREEYTAHLHQVKAEIARLEALEVAP
jgi:hypothetical protein